MESASFYMLQIPGERRYQYAWKDMAVAELRRESCPACGRTVGRWECSGPHFMILEGGGKYPDRLPFCGAGESELLLSEKAVEVFLRNGITGIAGQTPVRTGRERDGALMPLPEEAPGYVLAELDGTIDLDLGKMGLKKKNRCSVCGGFDWNRQRLHPLIPDRETWNGRDLCRIASIPGYIVCTDRVVELVNKHKLRGFAFDAL